MDRDPPPEASAALASKVVGQGLLAVNVEIVEHQMDRSFAWIAGDHRLNHVGELRSDTIGGGTRDMPSHQRLEDAEYVGGAAALAFIFLIRDVSWTRWTRRANVRVQGDRILVQAHDRFLGTVEPCV